MNETLLRTNQNLIDQLEEANKQVRLAQEEKKAMEGRVQRALNVQVKFYAWQHIRDVCFDQSQRLGIPFADDQIGVFVSHLADEVQKLQSLKDEIEIQAARIQELESIAHRRKAEVEELRETAKQKHDEALVDQSTLKWLQQKASETGARCGIEVHNPNDLSGWMGRIESKLRQVKGELVEALQERDEWRSQEYPK